jgi:hypothetical protein
MAGENFIEVSLHDSFVSYTNREYSFSFNNFS